MLNEPFSRKTAADKKTGKQIEIIGFPISFLLQTWDTIFHTLSGIAYQSIPSTVAKAMGQMTSGTTRPATQPAARHDQRHDTTSGTTRPAARHDQRHDQRHDTTSGTTQPAARPAARHDQRHDTTSDNQRHDTTSDATSDTSLKVFVTRHSSRMQRAK
ncbi:hypothetical protein BgiBS90_007609 [Biomphalaria glabrata]|nr:hypothetical protein BgiBS90_007609 [Biomphalaria glabrata]